MKNKIVRFIGGSVFAAVAGTGCGGGRFPNTLQNPFEQGFIIDTKKTAPSTRGFKGGLEPPPGEHVLIAAVATSHALGGRDAAFKGAVGGLDANSIDISKAIGSVYGPDAEKAFLPLWRKHIGFFVDYTTGVAAKDKAKQDKAVA